MVLVMQEKNLNPLTLSLPESVMKTLKVVQNFESVDEILWCDHSNETSSAVLSHGTTLYESSISQNEIWDFS